MVGDSDGNAGEVVGNAMVGSGVVGEEICGAGDVDIGSSPFVVGPADEDEAGDVVEGQGSNSSQSVSGSKPT